MITKQQAAKLLKKLGFEPTKRGKELGYKYVHEGTTILFSSVPKGRGPLHITDRFRKQLTLDRRQFDDGLACPFKAAHYLAHLLEIGRISSGQSGGK